jgi:protease-4
MKEEERQYFHNLVMDAYSQFRGAVKEGRKLDDAVLNQYADGRIFSGSQAVALGFADVIGVQDDAVQLLAELAGIKNKDYELFEPPKKQPSLFERIIQGGDDDEGEYDSKFDLSKLNASHFSDRIAKLLKINLLNRPLFLMPGVWDAEDSE